MIKTVLWDFDGVILDSMKIKGDGFATLFEDYEDKYIAQIEKYHYENGGVSRFEKIKYFYSDIINQPISEEKIVELSEVFSSIIKVKLLDKSNLIDDAVDFIRENYKKYNFHIVSGAEHEELNQLCKHFGLTNYFLSISGSPASKDTLVKNVIQDYNCKLDEVALIGDAMTDYNAAIKNKIKFYGFNNLVLKNFGNYIYSFKEIKI